MATLMPDPDHVPRVPLIATQVPNLRAVSLLQLADIAEKTLRRIVPQRDGEKPPVAAFDASL